MHLQPYQVERFYYLLKVLANYLSEEYSLDVHAATKDDLQDYNVLSVVADCLDQHIEAIDGFVSENPADLCPDDLDAVSDWRDAIFGRFAIAAHGQGYSAFLLNDSIVKVIGLTNDIAEILPDPPTIGRTVLLPFEGRIVYLVYIVHEPGDLGALTADLIRQDYGDAVERGAYVGTSAEFSVASEVYYSGGGREDNEIRIEGYMRGWYVGADIGEPPVGMHKSSLVGLSDPERWHRLLDDAEESFGSDFRKAIIFVIKSKAWHCQPARDLAGSLANISREVMEQKLTTAKVPFDAQMDTKGLARQIVESLHDYPDSFNMILKTSSQKRFDSFLRLLEADGIVWVSVGDGDDIDADTYSDLLSMDPIAFPPFYNIYYHENRFAFVLPEELIVLAANYDFDELERDREHLMIINEYASVMGSLYGIISAEDFLAQYARCASEPLDGESCREALEYLSEANAADWSLWHDDHGDAEAAEAARASSFSIDDDVSEDYYIAGKILLYSNYNSIGNEKDDADDGAGGSGIDGDADEAGDGSGYDVEGEEYLLGFRQQLLAQHRVIPPKPFDFEDISFQGINRYVLSLPEVAVLRDYLDAHVPDGEDDLLFASRVVKTLYHMMCWDSSLEEIFVGMVQSGIDFGAFNNKEQQRLGRLLSDATLAVPSWMNNGWSFDEAKRVGYNAKGRILNRSGGASATPTSPTVRAESKVGRNDPCPCGSGKKYKKCCGRSGA
jgi:hypothetical protein